MFLEPAARLSSRENAFSSHASRIHRVLCGEELFLQQAQNLKPQSSPGNRKLAKKSQFVNQGKGFWGNRDFSPG
jgi:hypothetical protein